MEANDGVPPTLKTISGITWRVLVAVAGLALLVYLLNAIFAVVFALFFAMLVTAWTSPLMRLLNRIMPKAIAMILALLIIVTAIVTILGSVIRSSISEGPKLIASIKSGVADIEEWLKRPPLELSNDQFGNLMGQVQKFGEGFLRNVAGDALGALGSVGTLIIAGSVFLYAVVFFLMAPQQIWDWLLTWIPNRLRERVDVSGHIAWDSISGYTRGIVIVAFCDGLLVFVGLSLLQVPLAPALAAVVFLGAFIPVVGAPVATFFAAIVALAERGPLIALLVVALTIVVGSFDGDVLQPLVMGKAVNLHPLAIVFSIAAGSIALGIIGALIAVPIAGAFYGVAKYLANRDPARPLTASPPGTPTPA